MIFRTRALFCLTSLFGFEAGAQTIGGCPVFPANNIWNARVDTLPVHSRSAAWVSSISPTATLHADFGSEPYNGSEPGLPINLVPGTQPKVPIIINEGADESDPGPYPFPANAKVEGGSDRHVLVVDTANCILYETYSSFKNADGSWSVYSAAKFELRQNLLRPLTWTSADAAGLPILPGLARYEEILEGEIRHALRFTAPRTVREFLWPARHFASSSTDLNRPPMGARFRLKANFDISSFSPATQVILTGLKRYGMLLADNGSSWYIQGTFDTRWPTVIHDEWRRIPGSAFEAVDASGLMDNIDSAAVRGSTGSAPTLQSAELTPSTVTGGQGSKLRVTLSGPARAGGAQVSLSSANAAVAPIAASVLVPENFSSADVPVSTNTVSTKTTVTLTAGLASVARTAALTVNAPAPTLQSANLLSSTVTGGQTATLRLTLSAAAGTGGVTVTLQSGNTGVATIAGSVQIPSGGSTVDVPVLTTAVQSQTQLLLTSTLAGVSRQATLTVDPPATIAAALSAATLTPPSVTGGNGTMLVISLTKAAPAGGFSVGLTGGNNTAIANLPQSVIVAAGSTSIQVPVTSFAVGAQAQVVLTASAAGVNRSATLTVKPPVVSALAVNPNSVPGGTGAVGTVTLTGKAPADGFTVSLSAATTTASVPATVKVPGGQTRATFAVSTQTVSSNTTVQIAAAAQGVSATANLTVRHRK